MHQKSMFIKYLVFQRYIVVFLIYTSLHLLYFLNFPIHNSLPGDSDFICNISMYKLLDCRIFSLITGDACWSFNYPMNDYMTALGADFGLGIYYNFLYWWFRDDIWTSWFFISTLYASNACGAYLMTNLLTDNRKIAFFTGIFFSFSQFSLANIEHPNAIFFLMCFISIYFLIKFIRLQKHAYLYISILIGALQIYLAPSVIVVHFVVMLTITLFYFKDFYKINHFKPLIFSGLLSTIIIYPYLKIFVIGNHFEGYYNPIQFDTIHFLSLNFRDFFRALPNHFLHKPDFFHTLIPQLKSAFIGSSMWIGGIIGILYFDTQKRILFITLIFVGVLFSFGPYLYVHEEYRIPSLLYPFYKYLNGVNVFRMPLRFFFISIIVLAIGLANLIYNLNKKKSWKPGILLFLLFFGENTPLFMRTYDQPYILDKSEDWLKSLKNTNKKNLLIACFPSNMYLHDFTEYIFMYDQYKHHQNILNGGSVFYSTERMKNDTLMSNYEIDGNLTQLIDINQIDYIIKYKKLMSTQELKKFDDRLHIVFEDDLRKIYQIRTKKDEFNES